MPVVDLDPRRPTPFTLLGIPLALWCDGAGDWHAVDDRCPHRSAPLSEGRIEDGELMCSYHGWRFDGQGRCTHIPQIADPRAQVAACFSTRAAVSSHPTHIAHGLLWVFGSSTSEAWNIALASAATLAPEATFPPATAGHADPSGKHAHATTWFFRDLALQYDTLTENLLDPSHVQFAHHGVLGSRNSPATLEAALSGPITAAGFAAHMTSPGVHYDVSFTAPGTVRYDFPTQCVLIYVYPTKPGWSRTGGRTTSWGPSRLTGLRPALARFQAGCSEVDHPVRQHPTLDGDTYMLHIAERSVAQGAPASATAQYFMPARSDVPVVAWHKWLARFGGQVPTCELGIAPPPALPRREVLDRYAHTKECKACSRALKAVDVASFCAAAVAGLAALLLLIGRCPGVQPALPAATAALLAAVAAAAGVVAAKLRELRNVYIFTDWVHADHN